MRIERDPEADSAYVTLADQIVDGAALTQLEVAPPGGEGRIVLDFDTAGRLLGLEVLGASALLPRAPW